MSLATLKRKSQITATGSGARGSRFTQTVTGIPAHTYGVHIGRPTMGTGLGPRIIHGVQPTKGKQRCVNLSCSAKAPIVQKSFHALYNARKTAGCSTNVTGCNVVKPSNDDASLYIEKKHAKALKCKKCCGDTNVTLSSTGTITSGQTQFFAGCAYTFSFVANEITSINGVSIDSAATSHSLFLPSELCDTNQVVIVDVGSSTTTTYPIVLPDTSEENCVKIHNCPNNAASKTTAYVKHQDKCPTTKTIGVRSASEQLSYIKARRTAFSADPVPKGGKSC